MPTMRDRLRTPPVWVFILALCLWGFVDLASLGSKSVSLAILVSILAVDVAEVWYYAALLRWPYNALGFLLVSGEESAKGVPRDVGVIRRLVTDEWEDRFGPAITRGTEQVWRGGRRCTWLILIALLLAVSGVPLHGFWSWVSAPALPLAVWWFFLRAHLAAEKERVRQQMATKLDSPRFDDFPSLIPDDYARWLEIRRAQKDA